jgi:repressor LexA
MRSKSEDIMSEILEYINETFFNTREVPSVQEIADYIGIAKSSASRYLTEMESRGMLRRNNSFYGLETNKMRKATRNIMMVPMVGNIACGTPILAEENIESYLTISGDFLGQGEFFALRAQGDSMINVGINDGDYVVIRKQSFADEGQIVVAMVNNCDCTLKRYFIDRQKKKVRLHPENDEMEDMYYKEVAIQGVAIKVIKNID